jgi:hypothetical protein
VLAELILNKPGTLWTCSGDELARDILKIDQQFVKDTTKHALAVEEAKKAYAEREKQANVAVARMLDSGTQVLLRLLVELPNSRRAETEADKVLFCHSICNLCSKDKL